MKRAGSHSVEDAQDQQLQKPLERNIEDLARTAHRAAGQELAPGRKGRIETAKAAVPGVSMTWSKLGR